MQKGQTQKLARQEMYVQSNTEERPCNQFCGGKAMSISLPARVFVAFGIQQGMRMRHIAICGLPHSTIFVHIIS